MIADPPTDLYWIKLENGILNLLDSDGNPVVVHEFSVLADSCQAFNFKIDPGSAGLRFRRDGDPAPDHALSWNDPADPPSSVSYGGTTEADTSLTITVTNPANREKLLETSFTLNFFNPDGAMSKAVLRFDPTIIQKPDEPDV